MKKKLNIENATNELRGGSAFFPNYKKDAADKLPEHPSVSPAAARPLSQAVRPEALSENGNMHAPQLTAPSRDFGPAHYQEPRQLKEKTLANQGYLSMSERVNAPTPARPNVRRIITRNSFETYEDQMESLRKLSYKEKMEGKLGSMSKMVRDAIDEYLEKRAKEF
jgi:hypothetical protein